MSDIKPIPDGCNSVNVYLVVENSRKALKFYEAAFGAKTGTIMPGPDGESTAHASMTLGNSTVFLTDENPQWNMKSPLTLGGSPSSIHLYVEDADSAYQMAVDAGCEVQMPLQDAFWGERYCKVKDPFGHEWGISTRVKNLTDEELRKGQEEWMASMKG